MGHSLKHSFAAGTPRTSGKQETSFFPRMSRRGFPDYFTAQSSVPVFTPRQRLMGEKVRTAEQALAISQASGGVIIQEMKSGTPGVPITCKTDLELRQSFPSKLKKHDYVVVQGFMPRLPTPR